MTNHNIFNDTVSTEDIINCRDFTEAIDLMLHMKHWRMSDLADAMGYTLKNVSCVLRNKNDMTLKFARRLEKASGISAMFWIELYIDKYNI